MIGLVLVTHGRLAAEFVVAMEHVVGPQEAIEASVGDRFEFEVAVRYDNQPFSGPVNVAIVPCASADVVGAGDDNFADADGDGIPDGFATSDADAAAIVDVNPVISAVKNRATATASST